MYVMLTLLLMKLYLIIVNLPGFYSLRRILSCKNLLFLLLGLDMIKFVDRLKYLGLLWTRALMRIVMYQDKAELFTVLVTS